MRMTGRRESSNVDDRRGMSGGKKAGLGLAGIVVVVVIALFTGQDPTAMLSQMGAAETQQTEGRAEFTEEEQQLATFSKQVLAGTEDVWTAEFKKMGKTYRAPKMVLFTSSVQTGCGGATSAVGP
ncbi:MAG: neutral zinc metallopeptidase, partial [Paludibacteraceae bacterium]|nr:neutral zinc metallopeptidase [Paludibacteraceae bacterium]